MSLISARKAGALLVLAAAISVPAIAAAPAQAAGSPVVKASGACAGGGVWTLKAKHDGARIEVEYEIDTNRAGQFWHVGISDNNIGLYSAKKWTVPPSGSFTVHLLVPNRAGLDTIRTHSTYTSGHSCTGSLHL
ncbi:MAG: hypothetical protein ABI140_04735 [Jatrophihabitantaceae bacterium]